MTFRFKLQALLKYRSLQEERAKQSLAREQMIVDDLQRHLAAYQAERLRFAEELESRKQENLPAPLYSCYMELLDFKELEIRAGLQKLADQEKKVEEATEFLAGRIRDRKIIEKAREKEFRHFHQEWLRSQEKEADELAVLRHGRRERYF